MPRNVLKVGKGKSNAMAARIILNRSRANQPKFASVY